MAGFFKRLFGGGNAEQDPANAVPDEIYKGIQIRANPMKDGSGQWRIAGTLTKEIDGALTVRKFVRADLIQSRDEAVVSSVNKAKMIIDQNGEMIWKGDENHPV